jgi:hypothetical protein
MSEQVPERVCACGLAVTLHDVGERHDCGCQLAAFRVAQAQLDAVVAEKERELALERDAKNSMREALDDTKEQLQALRAKHITAAPDAPAEPGCNCDDLRTNLERFQGKHYDDCPMSAYAPAGDDVIYAVVDAESALGHTMFYSRKNAKAFMEKLNEGIYSKYDVREYIMQDGHTERERVRTAIVKRVREEAQKERETPEQPSPEALEQAQGIVMEWAGVGQPSSLTVHDRRLVERIAAALDARGLEVLRLITVPLRR